MRTLWHYFSVNGSRERMAACRLIFDAVAIRGEFRPIFELERELAIIHRHLNVRGEVGALYEIIRREKLVIDELIECQAALMRREHIIDRFEFLSPGQPGGVRHGPA